jgi:hypothetical protein
MIVAQNGQCGAVYEMDAECSEDRLECYSLELTTVKSMGFCADKGRVICTSSCLQHSPVMAKLDHSHVIGHA